jgi:aryl carrier-like protein
MTNEAIDLFRKPRRLPSTKENPFERFGFSRNPFPSKPSVVIGSDDLPYLPDLHAQQEQRFEELMIPHPDRSKSCVIAFLMDYATRRGRGIGKTVFLNHQRKRIMGDLGKRLTSDSYVLFAIHTRPLPGGSRKFWQLAELVAKAMNEQGVIAKAMWRLRAFSSIIPNEILEQAADNPEETIGNDAWLRKQGVDVDFQLANYLMTELVKGGVRHEIAKALAYFGHDPFAWQGSFLAHQTDYRWRNEGAKLVFDDLVRLFTLAGFSKGLLLLDEMEKIITDQNVRERRTFVDLIRYYFIDGSCENTRHDFYSLFLTIHPYAQELLVPHWEAAGLGRFAALSREFAQEYTVYFHPLNQESAEPLVQVYLDAVRSDQDHRRGSLTPLDKKAVEEALVCSGGVPGKMLQLLYHVMERSIKEQWSTIGAEKIRHVFQALPPEEPEDDETDTTPLPKAQPDLKGRG